MAEFPNRAHTVKGRVVHAVRVTHENGVPEAVTACGVSLGSHYSEADHLFIDYRRCRRSPGGEPTKDQSHCDLNQHQQCSGYTEDEADPETCMCNCHDHPFT